MSDTAKLHALGLQLAEARRDVLRSRTVTRLLRDAYRLDDLGSSVDVIPDRFLMLIAENMFCDCAALFLAEPPGGSNYRIVGVLGVASSIVGRTFCLEAAPSFFFAPGGVCPSSVVETLSGLLGTPRLLWALDAVTGHALVLGGRRNATIEHRYNEHDREIIDGALAVYIDVLDRRRTRRLLEQARQEAEARDVERDSIVAMIADRMHAVLSELDDGLAVLGRDPTAPASSSCLQIGAMVVALSEGRQVLQAAREILEEKPSPVTLSLEWVSLSDLLLSVVRGAQPACLQHGVDLRLKPFVSKFRVYVDRIWIEMTLNALVAEALSCVAAGAEMAVEARHREDGYVSILISGRNRSLPQRGDVLHSVPNTVVFGQGTASTRRLVGAHGAILTSERLDAATSRFALSLPVHDCRDE